MHRPILLLLALAILACAALRAPKRSRPPTRFPHLKGWHKLFGVIAIAIAIFILLNPDFLALGLLSDTTFFDFLVLALSLQLQSLVVQAWNRLQPLLAKTKAITPLRIPSPGLRYLLVGFTALIAAAVSLGHKLAHRIFPS